MATVFHSGVPWYDRALEAARTRNIHDRVTDLAREYLGGVRVLAYEDPHGFDRVRVERGGLAAVLSPDGIVIGFVTDDRELRLTPKPNAGRGRTRGPRDYAELERWLGEAGYTVEVRAGHLAVLDLQGNRVATMPSTPSDRRSLLNIVSTLRRVTGLELRR